MTQCVYVLSSMNPFSGENPPFTRSSTSQALRCDSSKVRFADATTLALSESATIKFTSSPPWGGCVDAAATEEEWKVLTPGRAMLANGDRVCESLGRERRQGREGES